MGLSFRSDNPWRAELVRGAIAQGRAINGLYELTASVSSDSRAQVTLTFLQQSVELTALTLQNVVIEAANGQRPFQLSGRSQSGNQLTFDVSGPLDSARYTVRLVSSPTDPHPPSGFDPFLASGGIIFRQSADVSDGELDAPADPPFPPAAHVDYLTKDYQSFRRMMLDRLAGLRPDWSERNPADLGMALVETLAYAADHVSYYQDAVATEAHLGTARRRISVRRHARLLDYHMHDGRNARVFAVVTVAEGATGLVLPGAAPGTATSPPRPGTGFLTRIDSPRVVPTASDLNQAAAVSARIFESMHDIVVYYANNEIPIYAWGQRAAVLPQGATQATLIASHLSISSAYTVKAGDLLLFEERNLPDCPTAPPADPRHRHVVRLTRVTPQKDSLFDDLVAPARPLQLLEIEWAQADALPFTLSLAEMPEDGALPAPQRRHLAVARGNVVLADHGQTQPAESLTLVQNAASRPGYDYQPLLRGPMTQQGHMALPNGGTVPLDINAAACTAMSCALDSVHPAITLSSRIGGSANWQSDRDLLGCGSNDQKFVVEIDDEQRAYLRFGDGQLGREPSESLYATYRIGNGRAGNIGAESLGHVLLVPPSSSQRQCGELDLVAVRNPLPAIGGEDPEAIAEVRLKAPQAYRIQQRAVTEADYAALLSGHPEVRQARVVRRFTGSFHTLFIYVNRRGDLPVDDGFRQRLLEFLEPYRMAGHDLRIEGPRFVPLELGVAISLVWGSRVREVRDGVSAVLSAEDLPGGQRGLFHPDGLSFGQSIYMSEILSAVMAVPGVQSARVQRFRRYGAADDGALTQQHLALRPLEIPRLWSGSSQPSRDGVLTLVLEGSR